MHICNREGRVIEDGIRSDAEAVRWFLTAGRHGDFLEETGEKLHDVAAILGVSVSYHTNGTTVFQDPEDVG